MGLKLIIGIPGDAVIFGPGAPSSISSELDAKPITTSTTMSQSHSGVHKCSLKGRRMAETTPLIRSPHSHP